MSLTAWRTFVTVCRLGSLSAAAAELGYTQSAVSRQIAALEQRTAADLAGKIALVATGHAIALTPGLLATTLRPDVTTVALVNPPTRGIYAILPRRDPHPSAPLLLRQLEMGPWMAF